MMLCNCQVEFLGHSAMCAGHYDAMQLSSGIPGAFSCVCWQFLIRCHAVPLSSGIPAAFSCVCWHFRSGMMLCNCQVAFLGHSAMCAGPFYQVCNCQV